MAATALGACTLPVGSAPGTVHGTATIRVYTQMAPELSAALLRAFYDRFGNIRVFSAALPASPPGQALTPAERLALGLRQGFADVVAPLGLPDLVGADLLSELHPILRRSRLPLAPFGTLLNAMATHGRLYDLPYAASTAVMLYNVDRFTAAGLAAPRPDWTWADCRSAAIRLTKGTGGARVWGLWAPSPSAFVAYWLAQATKGHPAAATASELAAALRFFAGLALDDRVLAPSGTPSGTGAQAPINLFAAGTAAMMPVSTDLLPFAVGGARFHWDALPLPGGGGGLQVSVRTLAMAAGTHEPAAAWAFLRFATTQAEPLLSAGTRPLPAYRSTGAVAAWTARFAGAGPGLTAILVRPWDLPDRFSPPPPDAVAVTRAQGTAEGAVLSGRLSVADAMAAYGATVGGGTG